MTIYITGDTHGNFSHIFDLQERLHMFTPEDVLIILGDVGLNYYVYKQVGFPGNHRKYINSTGDQKRKRQFLRKFPGTLFCIYGNHEARPELIEGYEKKEWCGGQVYYQPDYPRLYFACDGEVYHLNGKDYIAIGGAYSVDKYFRLSRGATWFEDEQPSVKIKEKVEATLEKKKWQIHGILSHTCPYSDRPTELFLSGLDQRLVDTSTEEWLETIKEKCQYDIWYFGHYHGNKKQGKYHMLFHDLVVLE